MVTYILPPSHVRNPANIMKPKVPNKMMTDQGGSVVSCPLVVEE